ncbi:serine/threonine protein kinase [Streptomyces kunmingensis]|uniref:non-specific serine/threonine protein kinase n=1 Tax=Streptomyces kunmingensis TaxID=68225 RepID=A0ABU6CC52_9ACTN|nr:serine/threonine-protein kinase [Streptomyces kunmingensis]MEB3961621.1 serine/threonine protein kinase [Streptomyces kunmingensis]
MGGLVSERVVAGRYRLIDPLGEGGMGTVWRARDEVLGREVAVKEVRAPAGLPAADVERMYARLEREAWAAARVAHRNVVTLYDVATDDHRPWIVMELVRGVSLADRLDAEGPMDPQHAAHIGAEVLAALRAAHDVGVLHRDVKPGNVLLSNDGRVVLTDFGIAMVEGTEALTMTGEIIGSPEFLAPERALGRAPGPQSDLWSLGVLLYAAVEGHSPFRQDTPLSTLRAVVDEELPPPRRAGALTPVIEGLLRKDPATRTSAADAERDLRIIGAGGTLRDRPGQAPPIAAAPTETSMRQPATPPLPTTVPAPTGTGAATTTTTGPEGTGRRSARRASLALMAGIVALLLAIGGLTYALVNRDDGGGSGDGGASGASADSGSDGSSGGGSSAGGSSGGGGDGGSSGGGSTGGNGGSGSGDNNGSGGGSPGGGGSGGGDTSPPAPTVRVGVSAVRGDYSGACPPPAAQAPAFAATITVGRTPAEVEYRWVTRSGHPSEPGWKTLTFGSGSARSRTVDTVQTAYEEGGTLRNQIGVEVRSPVELTSNYVAYTLTCEVVTPTTGATTGSPTY